MGSNLSAKNYAKNHPNDRVQSYYDLDDTNSTTAARWGLFFIATSVFILRVLHEIANRRDVIGSLWLNQADRLEEWVALHALHWFDWAFYIIVGSLGWKEVIPWAIIVGIATIAVLLDLTVLIRRSFFMLIEVPILSTRPLEWFNYIFSFLMFILTLFVFGKSIVVLKGTAQLRPRYINYTKRMQVKEQEQKPKKNVDPNIKKKENGVSPEMQTTGRNSNRNARKKNRDETYENDMDSSSNSSYSSHLNKRSDKQYQIPDVIPSPNSAFTSYSNLSSKRNKLQNNSYAQTGNGPEYHLKKNK